MFAFQQNSAASQLNCQISVLRVKIVVLRRASPHGEGGKGREGRGRGPNLHSILPPFSPSNRLSMPVKRSTIHLFASLTRLQDSLLLQIQQPLSPQGILFYMASLDSAVPQLRLVSFLLGNRQPLPMPMPRLATLCSS